MIFSLLAFAALIGLPLYAWAVRGRAYAIFGAIVLAVSLPGATVVHQRLLGWLPPHAGTWVDAAFIFGLATATTHLVALVHPRLRRAPFRLGRQHPGDDLHLRWLPGQHLAAGPFARARGVRVPRAGARAPRARPPRRAAVRPRDAVGRHVRPAGGGGRARAARDRRAAAGHPPAGRALSRPAARAARAPAAAHRPDRRPAPRPVAAGQQLRRRIDAARRSRAGSRRSSPATSSRWRARAPRAPSPRRSLRCARSRTLLRRSSATTTTTRPTRCAPGSPPMASHLLLDDEAAVETPAGRGADRRRRLRRARPARAHPGAARPLPPPPRPARLLLLHDPRGFRHVPPGDVDLTLSGHTHGGQLGLGEPRPRLDGAHAAPPGRTMASSVTARTASTSTAARDSTDSRCASACRARRRCWKSCSTRQSHSSRRRRRRERPAPPRRTRDRRACDRDRGRRRPYAKDGAAGKLCV